MPKPIGFHAATGTLVIMENGEFPAGSLIAHVHETWTDRIQIDTIAGRGAQTVPWQDVTSLDGTFSPTGMADALAYLRGEFAKKLPIGEIFGVPVVAGVDLVKGQPVAVSRASGQLLPARADTYTLAFVAGLASADTAQGFANQPIHGAVTLPDWTALTGAAVLAVGQSYFLASSGGLTPAPDLATACVARVGLATAPLTLVVAPDAPVIL